MLSIHVNILVERYIRYKRLKSDLRPQKMKHINMDSDDVKSKVKHSGWSLQQFMESWVDTPCISQDMCEL